MRICRIQPVPSLYIKRIDMACGSTACLCSFCTLTDPIIFSFGVIQGLWIVCDDCMEHAHG